MGHSATPMTMEQAIYVMDEFHHRGDHRMEVLCHLLLRCVRIGDCLKTLKVRNLYHSNGDPRPRLLYRESKTGKDRNIPIEGPKFLAALAGFWGEAQSGYQSGGPVFLNRARRTRLLASGVKFLLGKFVGSRGIEQCSAYSFRKCGARTMWKNGSPIESVSKVLNHHSSRVTETYIQITPKDVEDAMKCLQV